MTNSKPSSPKLPASTLISSSPNSLDISKQLAPTNLPQTNLLASVFGSEMPLIEPVNLAQRYRAEPYVYPTLPSVGVTTSLMQYWFRVTDQRRDLVRPLTIKHEHVEIIWRYNEALVQDRCSAKEVAVLLDHLLAAFDPHDKLPKAVKQTYVDWFFLTPRLLLFYAANVILTKWHYTSFPLIGDFDRNIAGMLLRTSEFEFRTKRYAKQYDPLLYEKTMIWQAPQRGEHL